MRVVLQTSIKVIVYRVKTSILFHSAIMMFSVGVFTQVEHSLVSMKVTLSKIETNGHLCQCYDFFFQYPHLYPLFMFIMFH